MNSLLEAKECIVNNKWSLVIHSTTNTPYLQFECDSDLLRYTILHLFLIKQLEIEEYLLLPLNRSTVNLIRNDISIIFNQLIAHKELDLLLETVFNNLNPHAQNQLKFSGKHNVYTIT
jgi:hypothetical protein